VRLALTCGEPGGIGAETLLKALVAVGPPRPETITYQLIGPRKVWSENASLTGIGLERPDLEIVEPQLATPLLDWQWGKVTDTSAEAALKAVLTAAGMALEGETDAIVTAPLTKEGLKRAGCSAPGHTELLAGLCPGNPRPTMMFYSGRLKVILVTTHLPLSEVSGKITKAAVLATIEAAHWGLVAELGIATPRIGVCGLNPHAGENGQLGTEEIEQIIPAVELARAKGIDASGPQAADALFARTAKGLSGVDAIVSMYHDQGLTAFKFAHFDDGVNVTLGLPLVRTSPDHGTALDIAGRGEATPDSTIEAIKLAVRIVQARRDARQNAQGSALGDAEGGAAQGGDIR
jgi:4-hydroxythreonine-4-phosphate dehydrogenase